MTTSSLDGLRAGEERGQFCWCPPGAFQMGPFPAPPVAGEAVHVTFSRGFWMNKYLVTQAQYQFVMGYNPSSFVGASLPVETVDKLQADAFCEHLTRLERVAGRLPDGWHYRLPTEAQWEYACRAGTSTAYSWGDDEKLLGDYAWYEANSGLKTHAVGQKKPNPWGLYDMHGNCIEWCRDPWLDRLPGGVDPEVTKKDLPDRPEWAQPFWVCRGGSWHYTQPDRFKSRSRERLGPVDKSYLIGFRLALVADR
jgi:formylglycine-generating enzyme required for sulfatase activity